LQRIETSRDLRRQDRPTVPAPLSLELRTNPFLRTAEPAVAAAAAARAGHGLADQTEVFAAVRRWKDQF
jgi:hydroxyacylglutathione hydrolase